MDIKEKQFWNTIKKYLPGDLCRIENSADQGTPDVSACDGMDYWVELKVCKNKKDFKDVKKLLKPEQVIWHLRRGNMGSLIFVAVYYPNMKKLIVLYLYNMETHNYDRVYPTIGKKHKWTGFRIIIKDKIRSKKWYM
jgi:hypothetical protein